MSHTPGPWTAELAGCESSHGLPIIAKANGHLLAALAEHNHANARLIAAAPDLLEAAEAVVERWDTPVWKDAPATAGFIAKLRAAIRKARGEE